jgi:hypothetical protein
LQKIMEVFLKRLGVVLKNFGFKGDFWIIKLLNFSNNEWATYSWKFIKMSWHWLWPFSMTYYQKVDFY